MGILVKDNISIVRNKLPHLAHSTFEHIEILITVISIHTKLVVVQFIAEFGDFVEKLSACSGRLLLCGDYKINWIDNDNSCVNKISYTIFIDHHHFLLHLNQLLSSHFFLIHLTVKF